MKHHRLLLVLGLGLLAGGCADIGRSRNLANPNVSATTLAQQVCSLCHGVDGRATNPNFPNLAAQQPAYFIAQMKGFRSHDRSDPAGVDYMWGLSRSLTDSQIQGLADYYAATPSVSVGQVDDSDGGERGRVIFEKGVPEKNVPACSSCHGAQAQGNEQFPRLAHQHADYIVKQLKVFQQTAARPGGVIMKPFADGLSAGNMQDIASYLQSFGVDLITQKQAASALKLVE